jgi:hypothetical protein
VNHHPECEKCTEQLLDWLSVARDEDEREVMVRVKDPDRLEHRGSRSTQGIESATQREKQHAHQIMEDLVKFVDQLKDKDGNRRSSRTSWLIRSVFLKASPPIIEMLSKRSDVECIDVLPKFRLNLDTVWR